MSTIGTTLFSKIEINGQEVDIATLDANDGIYALPAGQTTANVKFTMIDNTSIPRGVFEENSYITAMTLPDDMTYIASYSFHGVNNINISDKNAILAINPYAFDAEPTPPSPTDPDFYFYSNNYEVTSGSGIGMDANLYNGTGIDPMQHPIQWSSSSSDITIDQKGYVSSNMVGATGTITATISDGTNTHTATCTVNVVAGKQTPTGGWVDSNLNPVYSLQLVEGNTSDQTLTFSATPNDSWTFNDPGMSGISVNTTTGEITITGASVQSSDNYISASRMEDASYYSGNLSLNIKVFPAGTDLKFYFDQTSVNLDNSGMTTSSPILINNTGIDTMTYPISYSSADTSIATVDNSGMISFVGAGNTTVTATISDGTSTHTATITVYCNFNKKYASASFDYNGKPYYGGTLPVVEPFTGSIQLTNMTPSDGWVISDPMIQGITVDNTNKVIDVQDLSKGQYTINVDRPEDSDYYSTNISLVLKVLPSGSNPNFYYEQESVNLDNQAMSQSTPMLYNNTGFAAMPTYQSADIAIATVDENGMISFVSGGTTTVTASITDGVDTYTTSITVNCNVMNA